MKLNKIAAVTAAAAVILSAASVCADGISVIVNGSPVDFTAAPIIANDRTLVEFRAMFEALGAEVIWDDETQTVVAYDSDSETVVTLQVGNSVMFKNEEEIALDSPAQIIDGSLMIPVRAVAESLSAAVDWNEAALTVIITE